MQLLGVAEHEREDGDVAEVGRERFLDAGEEGLAAALALVRVFAIAVGGAWWW